MNDIAAAERPKSRSARPLVALVPFLSPYRKRIVFAILALLAAAATMLSLPVAARILIDDGFATGSSSTVDRYFAGFLLLAFAYGAFAALRFYLVIWLGERVVADIRNAVYERVIRMDSTFFEVTRTGEVLSRLTTDTTLVQSIAGAGLSIALRSSLTLVGGLAMLLITSPKLTTWVLVSMPLILGPVLIVGRRVRRLSRQSQGKIADSSGLADETLNAIQTVQAFTMEAEQIRRFEGAVAESFAVAVRRIRVRALMTALAIAMIFSVMTGVMRLGSNAVSSGFMTAGEMGQFVMYAAFVGMAATALSELWGDVQRGAGAMERIAELLAVEPSIRAPANPAELPPTVLGRIEFDDVTFRYPSRPDTNALAALNLIVEPGETVALVGPSGAGKSTCFQLLLRFFDPQHGTIRVDGVDIATLDPTVLRRAIGLVPQETVLFGATAMENIRFGDPTAGDDAVVAAAQAAAADDFIQTLPDGYDTFLGERGQRLSGGQRQRIAIARAILRNPPILLLDEATSSLDAESEQLVQRALTDLMRDRTTLVIAHRLATVQNADRILVMDAARIVASGTHTELLADNALYARLAALQFGLDEPQPDAAPRLSEYRR